MKLASRSLIIAFIAAQTLMLRAALFQQSTANSPATASAANAPKTNANDAQTRIGSNDVASQTNTVPASTSKIDENRFSESVSAGQTLTVTGNFAAKDQTPVIKIHTVGSDVTKDPGTAPDTTKKLSDTQLEVKLPDKLAPGRYYLTLDYGDQNNKVIPSEVRVSDNAVSLDSAHPTTAYGNGKGSFDFDVIGQGFSSNLNDDRIYIAGMGSIIQSRADKNDLRCENKTADQLPCLWYESPDKLHVVGYSAGPYQGPVSFAVEVGSVRSAQKNLVLARLSPAGIRFWSIIIFGILAFIIYRLVARGMRDHVIDGQRYSPFYSFFLDKETDTYSLSKFQLLLFSSTFIFGYLYVFLCGWLVQWHFILPDVPASFSGILGMSAGTTIIAAGATSARGSKGAGGVRPSFADFITTGGQVVPERFQYFTWTLIACFGFIALLLSQDPATLSGFPDIPQGLLYVMGVSATGYLAGKVTRPPGPVVRNTAWNNEQKRLFVEGENLSKNGDFFIDGKKLPIVTADDNTKSLVDSTPQEQASDRSFCSELKITISDAAGLDLSTGDHVFRIMNKDAQFADARFTSDPPAITSVKAVNPPTPPSTPPAGADPNKVIAASAQNTEILVSGSGFRSGMIARWTPVGARQPVEITPVTVQDDKSLGLTLVPGEAGPTTLLLITSSGFAAVATVTVVQPASGTPTPGPSPTSSTNPSSAATPSSSNPTTTGPTVDTATKALNAQDQLAKGKADETKADNSA